MRPGSLAFRSQWPALARWVVVIACAGLFFALFEPVALAATTPPAGAATSATGATGATSPGGKAPRATRKSRASKSPHGKKKHHAGKKAKPARGHRGTAPSKATPKAH